MKTSTSTLMAAAAATLLCCALTSCKSAQKAETPLAVNPIIYADVPDMAIVRVDSTYYMSSTTMHLSPGLPVMKSTDLVNWQMAGYAYDTLAASLPALNLGCGKNTYGKGSWASCIRYRDGLYYVSTFAQTTGKTYIFSTPDVERGPWKRVEFKPMCHDHTFFFDDDGHNYIIFGNGKLYIAELEDDLTGLKPGTRRVLIQNASAPAGDSIMLGAEGSQLFKVDGKYYLFNIAWPKGGMRTVIVHRADTITGPYEGRVVFQDRGIAQGGIVDTPDGRWFAYLFQDCGAVGRIPYLVPVTWQDGWPIPGENGLAPDTLQLPASRGLIPGIVSSDDFTRAPGEADLPLQWQWNHNPDNTLWSLSERPGYLRLTTGRVDTLFTQARNTLTQRTFGPHCSGAIRMDASGMREGDFAGLALLQRRFAQAGVQVKEGRKYIVMINADTESPVEAARLPLGADTVYFKATCHFTDLDYVARHKGDKDFSHLKDTALFYYSLDGNHWQPLGTPLHMVYTMPHFMGYRFALFNYATLQPGGHADFDYFKVSAGDEQE